MFERVVDRPAAASRWRCRGPVVAWERGVGYDPGAWPQPDGGEGPGRRCRP
ncbi:MAG: hypothetical protein H0V05_09275 [Euzebyaceae bacterium]|nr:hypothetical protein [Euzebyaceae bacterium]